MNQVTSTTAFRRQRGRPSVEDAATIDDEILDVALQQFVSNGYGVSMAQIVKAAGVSKTTLYSRFSSKEELFGAIMRKQIARVDETMPLGSPKRYHDLETGLRNYANRALEVSLETGFLEVNRLIYSEAGRFPELGIAAAERARVGIAQLCEFIRCRAEIDGIPCKDPDGVAEVLNLLMRGWYVNAMLTTQVVPTRVREEWVARSVRILVSSREAW